MKKVFPIAFFLLLSLKSFSWGEKGHAMVAQVAFSYLDETTKKNVRSYLDGMSIEDAANWMDNIKSDKSLAYMKPYHYANFPRGAKPVDSTGANIVHVLNTTLAELGNKSQLSREEIKMKILFLFHLVGDLHQPLHVGYGDDKGGNTVQLQYQTRGTNLHSFWDSGIITSQNITLADCLNARAYSPEEMKTIKAVNVLQWSEESRSYLNKAYAYGNPKVQDKYVNDSAKIIKEQLQKAGIRLASVLQRYFKDSE